jgi:hypothetical protein
LCVGARGDAGLTIDQIEDEMAALPFVEPGAHDPHCSRRAELARRRGELIAKMQAASAPKPPQRFDAEGVDPALAPLLQQVNDPAVALLLRQLLSKQEEARQ